MHNATMLIIMTIFTGDIVRNKGSPTWLDVQFGIINCKNYSFILN